MIITDTNGRILRLVWRGVRYSRWQTNRGVNVIVPNDKQHLIANYGPKY